MESKFVKRIVKANFFANLNCVDLITAALKISRKLLHKNWSSKIENLKMAFCILRSLGKSSFAFNERIALLTPSAFILQGKLAIKTSVSSRNHTAESLQGRHFVSHLDAKHLDLNTPTRQEAMLRRQRKLDRNNNIMR